MTRQKPRVVTYSHRNYQIHLRDPLLQEERSKCLVERLRQTRSRLLLAERILARLRGEMLHSLSLLEARMTCFRRSPHQVRQVLKVGVPFPPPPQRAEESVIVWYVEGSSPKGYQDHHQSMSVN